MQTSDQRVVRQLPTLLASWLAGWLAATVAGCAVLPVAVYRPLPSSSVALDGIQEAQRSLADAWVYAETNFEAAGQSDSRVAAHGATFSIRRFVARGISLEDLAARQAFTPVMAKLLKICAKARLNILVSGGTGAGKTTFLNALSREINDTERLVTIEDSAELQIQQPHVVRLETRTKSTEGTGEVNICDLLVNALRMRPDRIIVGEVRGSEANEMLQAMNTGHPGSMCTIHANNPRDALMRLENMLMLSSGDMPLTALRRQIVSAIDIVVQLARLRSGHRCVTSITDVVGMEGEILTTEEMWRRLPGEAHEFESTGRQPSWMAAVDAAGLRNELVEVLQMSAQKNVEAAA